MSPEIGAAKQSSPDLKNIESTFLEWQIELIPARADLALPAVDPSDPWAIARVHRAAYVRTQEETERYVFYRGLGRLELPLSVKAYFGPILCVNNRSKHTIPAAFLIEMGPEVGRFEPIGAITGEQVTRTVLRPQPREKALVIRELEGEVTRALIAQGLYEAEAEAMVRTWSSAWFASSGRRVLYLLPRAVTDEVLPLSITPAPDKLVRVLVGRLEYMTEEDEALVQAELKKLDANDPAAMRKLAGLGRFLEPAVRRAVAISDDPAVRRKGKEILAQQEVMQLPE
jgi:hypothetical protein